MREKFKAFVAWLRLWTEESDWARKIVSWDDEDGTC